MVPNDYSADCLVRISALGYMPADGEVIAMDSQPSPSDIWDISNDVFTIYGCDPQPSSDVSGPEGQPDCFVGLHDFAVFAAEWLICGYQPVEMCDDPPPIN